MPIRPPSSPGAPAEGPISWLCCFCGSRHGARPAHRRAATELGRLMAQRDVGLVYGGADVGLMGAVADAVLDGGGRAVGVIPGTLVEREIAHPRLTELLVVDTLHQRKALMAERAHAFVALPGGVGTLDELFEILTWRALGLHHKPIGLLDVGGYFAPLQAMLDHMVSEGFVDPGVRQMLTVAAEPAPLLDALSAQSDARAPG